LSSREVAPGSARPVVCWSVVLFALWLVLTRSFDPQELIAGAVASVLVSLLVRSVSSTLVFCGASFLRRSAFLFAYVPYLLWSIVRANLDVARRVVNPRLPIRPGIVRVRTGLRSPLGRLLLTSSITLTPGTLTVDIDGDELFIHWIDVEGLDVEETSRKIVSGFERYLEVIFG
jgi:multicomponent Na+:H+ antiporter subunit E